MLRAIADLGYVPNQAARSLVTQRTNSYALVLTESASRVFSDDPFFPTIVQGVSQELDAVGKQLVLMMVNSDPSHDRVEQYAVGGHVDGMMVSSMHGADPLPATLARKGIPVVVNGRPMGAYAVPYVDVANPGPNDPTTKAALQVLIALRPEVAGQVSRIAAPSVASITLTLNDGRVVIWGTPDRTEEREAFHGRGVGGL